MAIFKWLYPGMKMKRWILLCAFGIIMTSMGFAIIISGSSEADRLGGSIVIILGSIAVITGIKKIIKSLVTIFLPEREKDLVNIVYQKRYLDKGPKIVTIGGGTGLSVLLHGLKEHSNNITAIVTVADDGGSSGRLREEFDVLPPGDIRNCLVALADAEPLMGDLFQFRFRKGSGLEGHNFGNLFITAMTEVAGDFEKAVEASSKVLAIRGRVIPSTLSKVKLVAKFKDGTEIVGESQIPKGHSPIAHISLRPESCPPSKGAIEAIRKADTIILGPGSLYTSIIPNLLVDGVAQEIANSQALKIYVCNVMTQVGETDSFTANDHLRALVEHTTPNIVDSCIVNTAKIPPELLSRYQQEKAYPVTADVERLRKNGYSVIEAKVISTDDYVRHDAKKLTKIVVDLIVARKKGRV